MHKLPLLIFVIYVTVTYALNITPLLISLAHCIQIRKFAFDIFNVIDIYSINILIHNL